tara:strand:+ start:144 stop:290 length:147 start_codon:yes stop_codon:yes gene_type:complete
MKYILHNATAKGLRLIVNKSWPNVRDKKLDDLVKSFLVKDRKNNKLDK